MIFLEPVSIDIEFLFIATTMFRLVYSWVSSRPVLAWFFIASTLFRTDWPSLFRRFVSVGVYITVSLNGNVIMFSIVFAFALSMETIFNIVLKANWRTSVIREEWKRFHCEWERFASWHLLFSFNMFDFPYSSARAQSIAFEYVYRRTVVIKNPLAEPNLVTFFWLEYDDGKLLKEKTIHHFWWHFYVTQNEIWLNSIEICWILMWFFWHDWSFYFYQIFLRYANVWELQKCFCISLE